jgi:hypothetical protein
MSGWLLILDRFKTIVAVSALVSVIMAMSLVLAAGFRAFSRRQQEQWENILLALGLVIFTYSRALSML